ncbi:MAG: NUDIX domain-containing protein [Candidatus Scalindua sp.]|nr:NUDIX domain-containing protein [Candidatus Scalindua sp.]
MTGEKTIYYCLQCGSDKYKNISSKQFLCESCGYTYFQNIAASVAAIIECHNQILVCTRKFDPCRGKLCFPGGFVDMNESAESALKREVFEELKIEISEMRYVGSFPNVYLYKHVEYHTLDFFFSLKLEEVPQITVGEEIAAIKWIEKDKINYDGFAFESIKWGLQRYSDLS